MANSSSTVNMKWLPSSHTAFAAVDSRGTSVVIGMWEEHEPEWRGLKASDMLLMSAISCCAYDIVAILKKQREPLEGLDVSCTGKHNTDVPRKFTHMHIRYQLTGDLNPDKVEKAIRLSEEKYCIVINTLKDSVEITSDFEILESRRV
jgi:putative redox protein